eukprot:3164390-Pleurochrysis_carterae.AAC.1
MRTYVNVYGKDALAPRRQPAIPLRHAVANLQPTRRSCRQRQAVEPGGRPRQLYGPYAPEGNVALRPPAR